MNHQNYWYIVVFIWVLGGVLYLYFSNVSKPDKVAELGRGMFWMGLLAWMLLIVRGQVF